MMVCSGVGLYVHFTGRKRRRSNGGKGETANEAAAEAGQAAGNSHCSQPPFPIAKSHLPQAGLFEPVGCPPRLGTPGGFSQNSFMQSITSSKMSGSMVAGKLAPYPAAMLGADKTAMHRLESQQQASITAISNSDLIRSGVAQRAQHIAVNAQHSAEEALSQEAAAAEAALGSFSRASSRTALHSCHTAAALPLPAEAASGAGAGAATQEAVKQAAASDSQHASQSHSVSQHRRTSQAGATQQMVTHPAAEQDSADHSVMGPSVIFADGQQQSGRGLQMSQGSHEGKPRVLPQQGYPGQVESHARGLQLATPSDQLLTQGQVKETCLSAVHSNLSVEDCTTHYTLCLHALCIHAMSQ